MDKILAYITDRLSKLNFLPIPADKFDHGVVGFVIAVFGMLGGVKIALFAVIIAGALKEAYDAISNKISGKHKHDVDVNDFFATLIGGILGIGVISLLVKLLSMLILGV